MEVGLRVPLTAEVEREGAVVLPGAPAARRRPLAARRRRLARAAARASRTSRSSPAPRRSTSARCAPRTSRRCPSPADDAVVAVPGGGVRRDDRAGRPLGLARRDAPDPHRHPRLGVRRRAADGRHRLLPPERQGDARSRRRSTAASRPTCRRARCRSSRGSSARRRRAASRIGVRANQVVFEVGGTVAVLAPDRRAVPQLPPAAARDLRARAAHRRRRAREVVRRISLHGAEERAAAAELQRGRADACRRRRPTSARRASRCRCRSQGEPFEIGFNPEFLRDGLESVGPSDLVLKLISPLRPGLIEAARRQRLPLPDHADPPERVGQAAVRGRRACACATSAPTRAAEVALGPAADRRARPQRRRQDEPARGAVLRLHRPLVPDVQRARGRALRRAAPRVARRGRRRDRDGEHELSVGFQPGEPKRFTSTARRSSAWSTPDAPAGQRLPARPARAGQGPAGAAPRAPRPGRRGAVAGARGDAPRSTRGRSRSATRCSARVRAGARRARRWRPGTPSWRATASRCATTAPPRSSSCARASPRPPRELGLAGAAELRYRPRSRARPAEELAAELRRAPGRRPRARLHRRTARTATTSALLRDGRELRAYGSQGEQRWRCWRCCWPSATCSRTSAARRR